MPIYEAGTGFFKLVYGWCMAGVWLVYELVYDLVYGWCMIWCMAGVWLVYDDGYAAKDLIGF